MKVTEIILESEVLEYYKSSAGFGWGIGPRVKSTIP
jgi:hypothetical protein